MTLDNGSVQAYQLRPAYDAGGDPIYRAVTSTDEDRRRLTLWYLAHTQGREHVRATFGEVHYMWNGPDFKPEADFPSSTAPSGIWSARSVAVLDGFFRVNGDLYPLHFEGAQNRYMLYDCWSKFEAVANEGFSPFVPGTLKSITVGPNVELPDIYLASNMLGLMVSERFKAAAEAAGLTGMVFSEVAIIRMYAAE